MCCLNWSYHTQQCGEGGLPDMKQLPALGHGKCQGRLGRWPTPALVTGGEIIDDSTVSGMCSISVSHSLASQSAVDIVQ